MIAQPSLRLLSADIAIPILPDGTQARAYVTLETQGPDHGLTEPCHHVDNWLVVFGLDYGLHNSAPVGVAFTRPAEAAALARLLNSEDPPADAVLAATTTALHIGTEGVTAEELALEAPQRPVTASPRPAGAEAGPCAACGAPLPPSHQHRRTCSDRCRQRLRRGDRLDGGPQLTLALEPAS